MLKLTKKKVAWERNKGQHKHVCFTAAYKDYFNRIGCCLSNLTLPSAAETTALMKWPLKNKKSVKVYFFPNV